MTKTTPSVQAIRHATMLLHIGGKTILTDPMLSPKGAMEPSEYTSNKVRIPLVDLPVQVETLFDVDAILLTHMHFDHFDVEAEKVLPRHIPVICQPGDADKLESLGFRTVIPVDDVIEWEGISIEREAVNHGSGEVLEMMGDSSAFVLRNDAAVTLIGGDAVYDEVFASALDRHEPDTVILFAGEARLIMGAPITMGSHDVIEVARRAGPARVIVVHMEALNHCGLSRNQLRTDVEAAERQEQVVIPEDGEIVELLA